MQGRVLIRYKNGKLLSEINKLSDTPVYLALEKGEYTATIIQEKETLQGSFSLTSGKLYELTDNSFNSVTTTSNRLRGEEKNEERLSDDTLFIPCELSLVMNEISRGFGKKVITPFGLSLFHSNVYKVKGLMLSAGINEADIMNGIQIAAIANSSQELKGIQTGGIFNSVKTGSGIQTAGVFSVAEDFSGIQISGIFNTASDFSGIQASCIFNSASDFQGIQAGGIFNAAKSVKGLQLAGIFNKAEKIYGLQIGLINIAGELGGVQLGLINICNDGILEIGASFTSNRNTRLVINSGKRYLYAIAGLSFSGRFMFDSYDGDRQVNFFYGLGTRSQLNIFNFDFENKNEKIIFNKKNLFKYKL